MIPTALGITAGLLALSTVWLAVAYARLSKNVSKITVRLVNAETELKTMEEIGANNLEVIHKQIVYIEKMENELVAAIDNPDDLAAMFTRVLQSYQNQDDD